MLGIKGKLVRLHKLLATHSTLETSEDHTKITEQRGEL